MSLKYSFPWIGRLYRERDAVREDLEATQRERDAVREDLEATQRERDAIREDLEATQRERGAEVNALLARMQEGVTPSSPEGSIATPRWRWDRPSFLGQLPSNGTILDVGCGNNGPYWTKHSLPDWYYIGLDIEDCNQTLPNKADKYILTTPEAFCEEIESLRGQLDAVVSSHNLEHCLERDRTLFAMGRALKSGGQMFLSFPCQDSVYFPDRKIGTLNYYDDSTHLEAPPDFGHVISALHREGLRIVYAATRYQPPPDWIHGVKNEDESASAKEVKHGTWAYWGFETVIWAERP